MSDETTGAAGQPASKAWRCVDKDGVRTVELDRPDKANALTADMMRGIAAAARSAAADGIGLFVLRSAGGNHFCAGADLGEFVAEGGLQAQEDGMNELFLALASLPMPLIVVARGSAMGAGALLVSLADITIAADDLKFGLPEINFNLYPVLMHVALLYRVPGPLASQWCSTGRNLGAREAQAAGVVSDVIEGGADEAAVQHRLDFYAERRAALRIAKETTRMTLESPEALLKRYSALMTLTVEKALPTIERFMAKHRGKRG